MNSSQAPHARTVRRENAAVIGSGFGGLAAAIRLQARGHQTTLFERCQQAGGRAGVIRDQGFTFDTGPTVITAPFMIDDLYTCAGEQRPESLRIVPVDPFYRVHLHDGSVFNYRGDEASLLAEIEKFSPADVEGYKRMHPRMEEFCQRAFVELGTYPFTRATDMLRVAPELAMLRADRSVASFVGSYIRDPRLRRVFTFNSLLIGGHPFRVSSIYAMIHALERRWGMHYVMGGTNELVRHLVDLFVRLGGTLRLGCGVKKIIAPNRAVRGLDLEDGSHWEGSLVVSNADTANTYRLLMADAPRRVWTDRRLERMAYTPGLFLICFGTDRKYPELAHHTILLAERYRELLDDIFDRGVLPDPLSLYLHAPSRNDPSLAPEGGEAFYVLAPVPNLSRGLVDWDSCKERLADSVLAQLEGVAPGLRSHIVNRHIWTPLEYERVLGSYHGSGFQFEPTLLQSAWFRPHNISEEAEGLYLVGAGTHPGAGVPGVLCSAELLEKVLAQRDRTS